MTDSTGARVRWGAVISVLLGMVAFAFSVSTLYQDLFFLGGILSVVTLIPVFLLSGQRHNAP